MWNHIVNYFENRVVICNIACWDTAEDSASSNMYRYVALFIMPNLKSNGVVSSHKRISLEAWNSCSCIFTLLWPCDPYGIRDIAKQESDEVVWAIVINTWFEISRYSNRSWHHICPIPEYQTSFFILQLIHLFHLTYVHLHFMFMQDWKSIKEITEPIFHVPDKIFMLTCLLRC